MYLTVLRLPLLPALTFSLLCGSALPAAAADKKAAKAKAAEKPAATAEAEKATPAMPADHEAATRLQVFLDRANFGPGKIDGRFGGFSEKALGLYREAHGLPALPAAPAAVKEEGQPEMTIPLPALVTIGSAQTESPLGEWKVKGIARLQDFRYDLSFLKTGERGDKTYLLAPGPNNPVGVIWVALNKPGIGLHGTSDPDAIGRSASHGCVRLANWDIARPATRVRAGVVVSIH